VFAAKIDDLGGCRGNAVQALANGGIQWLLVKPGMCSIGRWVPHHTTASVIKIARKFTAFFVVVDFLFAHNRR
jgi:hypothetical protein